jgi:hypothetical protein
VQVADFRRLALSMPDAVEGAHQQHPDFRVQGRVFATLHPDGATGMVKLSPLQQQALVRTHPRDFAPANGAWGRAGCTNVNLATVDSDVLTVAMTDAWQLAMAQPAAKQPRKVKPGKRRAQKRS